MGKDLVSVPESESSGGSLLAPGFRFHPTDEELVSYYLKRKVCGKRFRLDAISDVDVYKSEPWDLPGKSKLRSRDLEWYFFSVLDKKYGNGSRTNRATEKGYWKTTGKDRAVFHRSKTVGMKKTLVYHSGRAPRGLRTNWVMHEYRLLDEQLAKAGIYQDAFVLCRIFQKSGSGPKNGEQYGAPFVEEEWEDDELVMVPGMEVAEESVVSDDLYLDSKDLEQIFAGTVPVGNVPLPLSCYNGDNSGHVEELLVEENYHALEEQLEGQHSSDFPSQNHVDVKPLNPECVGESSNSVKDLNFLLDEPFFDAISNAPLDDKAFLETDDLFKPIEADPYGLDMLEEYLNFFDADENNSQYMTFDSSYLVGSENFSADQASITPRLVDGEAKQEIMGSQQQLSQGYIDHDAFQPKQRPENVESGPQYSFIKKASHMLGSITAPPAFASEFPTKESILHLASGSSSSVHLTAGMIKIEKPRLGGGETNCSLRKNVDVSFVVSFGLSHHEADNSTSLEPSVGDIMGKVGSGMLRSMTYLMFVWVLILSVTYKVGTCFYSGNTS